MAVRPPPEVVAAVSERVGSAQVTGAEPGMRWATADHWHFTLLFLGPVAQLAPVEGALGKAAGAHLPFSVQVGGASAFPGEQRARVVWLGVADGAAPLVALAATVAAALRPVGYTGDRRPFRPHLTVARLKAPAPVPRTVVSLGPAPVGPAWVVDEVLLYRSDLSPSGSTYTVLGRFPLGPDVVAPIARE